MGEIEAGEGLGWKRWLAARTGGVRTATRRGNRTPHEAGQAGQGIADAEGFACVTATGRGVLTLHRRHVIRPYSRVSSHAGIIVCTRDDVAALADRIHQ